MIRLVDFKGVWLSEKQSIQFNWNAAQLLDNIYVHFVGVQEIEQQLSLNFHEYFRICTNDLHVSNMNGTTIRYNHGGVGVSKKKFCAFADRRSNIKQEEIVEGFYSGNISVLDVVIGTANLSYTSHESTIGTVKVCSLVLKSDAPIASGIVGYFYNAGDFQVKVSIPQAIDHGETKLPPVVIPANCNLTIAAENQLLGSCINIVKNKAFKLF